MAWYHVNRCNCPVGCCDCGIVPKSQQKLLEEKLGKEIEDYSNEITFKAKYKAPWDKRKRVIKNINEYNYYFYGKPVSFLEKPTLKLVIAKVEEVHDKFKNKDNYSIKLLKKSTKMILDSLGNYSNRRKKVDEYFKHKFEYIKLESEW